MGKSALNVFDDLDQFKLYLDFSEVIERSGVVPNCTNNPEFFFPDSRAVQEPTTKLAKKACKSCPLMNACATYAISAHEREGIWGGLLPYERDKKREIILSKNDTKRFMAKGFLGYFRLRAKVQQLPIRASEIYD